MNKYRDKSDFEINRAVFHAARIKHKWFKFLPHGVVTYNITGKWVIFDPCNNPADAMPIIIENGICMSYDAFSEWCDDGSWIAQPAYGFFDEWARSDNYYRAAMICFLMMKDAENEKS